ncbi:MAG: hypothetical protein A2W85_02690 [Bacteroidetes bacterium GWF2_41_31]|nr:MAG: hypothetical protein A2W85_02690 [Bacteroidetes bacterium GWF2_41_31]
MNLTLSDFFFNTPIYTKITVTAEDTEFLRQIFGEKSIDFDGFNPFTKLESTFRVITNLLPRDDIYLESGGFASLQIKCKRSDDIFRFYILWSPASNTLTKIGQYPSVADFHISEIKQYSKLLPNEKLKEFTHAIGLAANGVGIGSFVYLRRIFEHLISEAYGLALEEKSITESDFQKARMDEKIDLLQNYLPKFLVENKSMYSIISLGIHELDEKTCLAHFDTLRVAIEIILDEKLDELRKQEKIKAAKKKLEVLKGEIKK